jgi:hypothetical protein
MTAPGTPGTSQVECAHLVAAVHVPDNAGFCRGCLDAARLAWSPVSQRDVGAQVLAAAVGGSR